ncbi:MAG TPA: NifU family protein [Armatimonadota bacterium]|jgi:Fe-S cluster biogenesis protein NfuA|nr:NifU family protein [Armatimonadota bacterium]HOM72858.1 NifU family protein [Armatimonadota bacterium]HPP73848.1 NifU family protein [Armatimonadota bacterium]
MADDKTLKEQVQKSIDEIRPALQLDGGDVELVDVEDGVVKVKLTGACHGCPMAAMTLQMGIERKVKQDVPDIKGVEAVSGITE